ncbi:hypothetical protein SAMN04487895_12845 [Paenibacillus sophorae]|uniref:Uncharacterized protein n=1 Tax=Paenibacillus sophorae TaxID=1333845 RepID=A0A1H8VXX7_9BACL|nr:hypothetical protein [Paenibacillus sophorae]QWU15621.1 hypothetical protein KP014_27925 [Paenibacillus sophorae]SEP19778.1 hypothetical protein SAMN04487895_12845 [Paenibacillus sophorae]
MHGNIEVALLCFFTFILIRRGAISIKRPNNKIESRKRYIIAVIKELERLGYSNDEARKITIRYYRIMARTSGFYYNVYDFAKEIIELEKSKKLIYDPLNPNHINLEPVRQRIKLINSIKGTTLNGLVSEKNIKRISHSGPEVIKAYIHTIIQKFSDKK